MEFHPNNPVVKLCLQGMAMEDAGKPAEAAALFMQAWDVCGNDFERFLAGHYVARCQTTAIGKLEWLQICLDAALKINDSTVQSALPNLYLAISACYTALQQPADANKYAALSARCNENPVDKGPFYHGTKAKLQPGDVLLPGRQSNYTADLLMNHIYFTASPNGAGLAAALAKGEGKERVYIIEPTGVFENDPNVTDKKFPGNPTRSYRSQTALKIVGEVKEWVRQTPAALAAWRAKLAVNPGGIIN